MAKAKEKAPAKPRESRVARLARELEEAKAKEAALVAKSEAKDLARIDMLTKRIDKDTAERDALAAKHTAA